MSVGNIELLRTVQTHGGEITRYQNEGDANNTLLHYAVKLAKFEVIDFLVLL